MAIDSHQNLVPAPLVGIFERAKPLALCPRILSVREAEILSLAIMGMTDDQIAQSLEIRVSTVNSYWVRIRSKMGPYSRTQIVAGVLTYEHQRELQELRAENERLRSLAGTAIPDED